jgi:ABC-2 type transport system ATP-binding protein
MTTGNPDNSATESPPAGERALVVRNLHKTFASGFEALRNINLDVDYGEIFALLGPNGAGKTTLISIICGLVNPGPGRILANGYDVVRQFRQARQSIGLVPQEIATDAFVSVWSSVSFSRSLFGKPRDPGHVEKVLRDLSLWDKRDNELRTLSGGMKRRVMIAKALVHEPDILFLDEPTAGVDVELRREMWALVRELRDQGVTIILTTHYIEEAEDMADRIGVINHGELVLVEETRTLMNQLGRKELRLHLHETLDAVPGTLSDLPLTIAADGHELVYTYNTQQDDGAIPELLRRLDENGIEFRDLYSRQSSLEEIFVNLVRKPT